MGVRAVALYVGGSSLTSTIPGLTVAGRTLEDTLYTPTLDLEYLVTGMPITLSIIPMTPDGLPTPALLTRATLSLIKVPYLAVDAGTRYGLRAPHVRLPRGTYGNNIAEANAFSPGTARAIFEDAFLLGSSVSRGQDLTVIGETIPGGTTLAAAIMSALGYDGVSVVSSASPQNPKDLKKLVVSRALSRLGSRRDPFEVIDVVGDPVHVAMAGIASGALEAGARVMLAGGTQMGAVLALLKAMGRLDTRKVSVATTRWIVGDGSANMERIVSEVGDGVELIVSRVNLSSSRFEGLRRYEEGYVKEGVGAGGTMVLAEMMGVDPARIAETIDQEYERLVRLGQGLHG